MSNPNNTAAAQASGYILQLERALHHLAHAGVGAAVAVEHLDDVVVLQDGKAVLQEQDKSTSSDSAKLLADRSKAIWRTLEIWLLQWEAAGEGCERYLFFVNRPVDTVIATLLKQRMAASIKSSDVLAGLKAVGSQAKISRRSKPESDGKSQPKTKPRTKSQALIDRVLERDDSSLLALIDRIEIVEATDALADRASMANGLGLSPRANADDILDNLFGWLTRRLRAEWAAGRPGIVTRAEVLIQKDALQERQARSRLMPRPSSDVLVSEAERAGALSRPFVEHLSRIDAETDDVVQAVDHFLKFNAEKHRLVVEGEVADREWSDRGHRLCERWQGLMRRHRRELKTKSAHEVGQAVLADATYDYREPLDGHACDELYMTSGHYHRLADQNDVWWHPEFSSEAGGEN